MLKQRIISCFYHLRSMACDAGNVAIEFAAVAPIVLLITLGTVEFGTMFFVRNVMEGVTSMGARAGITGANGSGNREAFIRSIINQRSGGILDPSRLRISQLSYNGFNAVGEPEPCRILACNASSPPGTFTDINGNGVWDEDQGLPSAGGPGAVVLYTVEYDWNVVTPMIRYFIGNSNGNYTLRAVATVKNEQF